MIDDDIAMSSGSRDPGEKETLLATIFSRIKWLHGFDSDATLATTLRVDRQRIATWKFRDSIPWESILEYSRREGVSLEWLVNGNGSPRTVHMVAEPGAVYRVRTDQDAVYTLAARLHALLQARGRDLPSAQFARTLRLAHRETLDHGAEVPNEKLIELIELAAG